MAETSHPGQPDPLSAPPVQPDDSGSAPIAGAESGPDPADGTSERKGRRKRRKRRSRWLVYAALTLAIIAAGAVLALGGWMIVMHMVSGERVIDAVHVPGQFPGRKLRDGDVLDVPMDGRLVLGGAEVTATLVGGTKATVAHAADGLDLTLSDDATVTADASFTAPARLRVISGAVAAELTSGHLRLRRRGGTVAIATLSGPLLIDRGGVTTTIDAKTWVAVGADGHLQAPRPAALRAGMIGWWPGDEGGGSVLHECSGAGAPWPLTLTNATWGPDGIDAGNAAGTSATIASAPVPSAVTTALLVNSCSFEIWLTRPGAPTTPLTVLDITDGTGVDLRIRLPPLPLGPGRHDLVVTFGRDRHQVTWVDGRMHADVPAPVLPNELRPPLTLVVTGATTVRACAIFATTLDAAGVKDLYHAGSDAP